MAKYHGTTAYKDHNDLCWLLSFKNMNKKAHMAGAGEIDLDELWENVWVSRGIEGTEELLEELDNERRMEVLEQMKGWLSDLLLKQSGRQ
jgi:hypothetical protein